MKNLLGIFLICIAAQACKSSYDEAKAKPEIRSSAEIQNHSPIVESTSPNAPTPATPPSPSSGSPLPQSPAEGSGNVTSDPRPVVDPATIMVQHEGSAAELKKYNCKGTALITDSGIDDNQDGILQDDEIQETRIDCTEVVPGK